MRDPVLGEQIFCYACGKPVGKVDEYFILSHKSYGNRYSDNGLYFNKGKFVALCSYSKREHCNGRSFGE